MRMIRLQLFARVRTLMPITRQRLQWLIVTWALTWYIPCLCLFFRKPDRRMAFREKVAICTIIFLLCSMILFLILGLGRLLCPVQPVTSVYELSDLNAPSDPWVYMQGRAYQIQDVIKTHTSRYGIEPFRFSPFLGQDVSELFFKNDSFVSYCPGLPVPNEWDNVVNRHKPDSTYFPHTQSDPNGQRKPYTEYMNKYAKKRIVWSTEAVAAVQKRTWIILQDNVYDVTSYFASDVPFLGNDMSLLFSSFKGRDGTKQFVELAKRDPLAPSYLQCMNQMFYIGGVDHRSDLKCKLSNYLLLGASALLVAIIGFKFIAALQFGSVQEPFKHEKYVLVMIPCYSEGVQSLMETLQSCAQSEYPDDRKLLVVIADGIVLGKQNDKPTAQIASELLGVRFQDQPVYGCESLGEQQQNRVQICTGFYDVNGHRIPFVLIVKIGLEGEQYRQGNRGKRDSQLLLMRFLSRVHYNLLMSPFEIALGNHMVQMQMHPKQFEFILMVDADTTIEGPAINKLVATMLHDTSIAGLCGETLIANENESWVTMIQVYEYYISHHLSKAFESLFGTVTCLPGCFCMYRIKHPVTQAPIFVSRAVVEGYGQTKIDTLHLKNLLALGEDRYLTTLVMKHFARFKLKFDAEAKCHTRVPSSWTVLMSQRRRWINSTVHNLVELLGLSELCGFCCFSLRFVVFMDLFSTVVQPAGVLYLCYLVYCLITATDNFPLISFVLLAAIYGLQVLLFILKQQWAQIGWMVVYILAMPIFGFYMPLYSFWHMDDFRWGSTSHLAEDQESQVEHHPAGPIAYEIWDKLDVLQPALRSQPSNHLSFPDPDDSNHLSFPDPRDSNHLSFTDPRDNTGPKSESVTSGKSPAMRASLKESPLSTASMASEQEIRAELRALLCTLDLTRTTPMDVYHRLAKRYGSDLDKDKVHQWIHEIVKE
ncbi:chitin synthase-domain-containing protein [Gorgonomyces haynaldii]|nr:chitin synthase-domain-containing protein [Gorgonomyces haynaldii]